jgi:predicted dehydrogenase
MGGTHARSLAAVPGVQVVGVSGRTPEKVQALAQEVGARPVLDPKELIQDSEVDAISITLPSNLHCEYAVAALEAGKPVLVEKPMALSVAECDEMIAAARRTGKVLMVGQVLRFWPDYVAFKKYLDSGEIGRPLSTTAWSVV